MNAMESAETNLKINIKKHKIKDLKITLVGHAGAGKSTFINSVFSTSRGRMVDLVGVKSENVAGLGTLKFDGTKAGPDDMFQSVTFFDTMGFSRSGNKCSGISEADLKRVCNGEIKIRHQFNLDTTKAATPKYRPNCVIFVASAEVMLNLDIMTDSTLKDQLKGLNACVPRDIAKIAVVTKCDNICNDTAKDASNIFKSRIVERVVKRAASTFGLQENKVFPIVNYTKEVETNTKLNVPIMYALRYALDYATDRVEDPLSDED
ncbi:interferon-induced protein 44-like [Mya arenaria]|uniref:interferon-induced protein 44-like n=1 Tax=Mya arenaria TaxID=6604 RepID=UPI0022E8CAE6|nr:interferon-induced protein 44-like [Mya arenaria]